MTHAILSTLIPFKLSIPLGVDVMSTSFEVFDDKEKLCNSFSFLPKNNGKHGKTFAHYCILVFVSVCEGLN